MLIPTKRLLLALILGATLSIFPIFIGKLGILIWLMYLVLLSLFLIGEYLLIPLKGKVDFSLKTDKVYYVESSDKIIFTLKLPNTQAVKSHLHIVVKGPVELEQAKEYIIFSPGTNTFSFSIRPLKRGKIVFEEVRLKVLGYLGLWYYQVFLPVKKRSNSVPNIRGVGKYALRFYSDRQAQAGLKVEKYRGEGSEFESLREYLPGFDTRTIDWKASARRAKMFCREFRAERNNDIILALDCGRLMAAELEGITKLDYAINSLLFISYFAIKSGDRIGFISFSNKVHKYLKPRSNLTALDTISHQCEDIGYDFKETNFVVSMEYLLAQQKRRSLIIVLTDFVDTTSAEIMRDYLGLIARNHLILFVAVRDPFLEVHLTQEPKSIMNLHEQISCYHLKDERFKMISELKRLGIHCLDLLPNEISIPVLNRYMDIRRREMI